MLNTSLRKSPLSIAAKAYQKAKLQQALAYELNRPQDSNPFTDVYMKGLAAAINQILTSNFTGYEWTIGLSRSPPMITLRCVQLLTREVININPKDIATYDDLKRVIVREAGLFLERVNASREKVNVSHVEQLTQGYSRLVIPDRSCLPKGNMDKRYVVRPQST